MINEIQYTNIRRVLDNIMTHPLLRDVTLEQAVRYAVRFIGLHGYSKLYQERIGSVEIKDFRGLLPCDLISIIQVRDARTGVCLRSMTDTFAKGMEPVPPKNTHKDLMNNVEQNHIPPMHRMDSELSFKTQGRAIFTSFPEGCVEIAYKAIPIDDDGFPLLIDNETYLAALEAFIKMQVFTIKFDIGKINANVLQNAQQEYYFRAGQLNEEFQQPSVSEMQTLTNVLNTLIVPMRSFDRGFTDMGNREYLRRH